MIQYRGAVVISAQHPHIDGSFRPSGPSARRRTFSPGVAFLAFGQHRHRLGVDFILQSKLA